MSYCNVAREKKINVKPKVNKNLAVKKERGPRSKMYNNEGTRKHGIIRSK